MATFGTLTLLVAFVVATYAGTASLVGARRGSRRLVDSGRGAAYLLTAVLGMASVAIVYAFVTHDFSIKYVHRYSDANLPIFYLVTAYWGGLDGSILWWVFLLSVFSSIAIYTNRDRHREMLPYVVTVLMGICDFFLYLIVFHKNPFETYLTDIPTAGLGLNPILQNAYMITHPPSLYIGFVGMSIPFAFGLGALISGQLDDTWLVSVRRWTLIAWFFLSMGLTLGMLWAYEELGWGGFWGWDPVENAGFLPWLTATAFLHSVMIQERRGMLKIWTVTLVILTFFLTIFGTFMTRSGVVQSVHAFGQDAVLAKIFIVFMALLLVVSFGFVIKRLPELRSRAGLDSFLSREFAFIVNNWILVFAAAFVLFATMFPTLSEAVTGQRITVVQPFFNKWMVPIGLTLLFLTGVGPLIAWRKATASHLRYQFALPAGLGATALVGCLITGLGSSIAAVICFAFCAFVMGTVTQEFARGVAIRKRNTGGDALGALVGMVLRGKRRYGGYIVHVGIVLMFVGFAGQAYQKEEEIRLAPGQQASIGRYTLRFDKLSHDEDRQKEMVTGEMVVLEGGREIGRLRPAKWHYRGRDNEPATTEVAIRRSPAEDLYVTLATYDLGEGVGNFKLVVNPLVDWVWVGFMMLALGTGIALTPDAVLQSVVARIPAVGGAADAAGRAGGAAALVLALSTLLVAGAARAATPAEDQKWLESNILCMCGMGEAGCRHMLKDCDCGYAPNERETIRKLLAEGKSRDEVVQAFVKRYGHQMVLGAPIDRGFNRLAWALPYGAGAAGAVVIAFGAWRMSRKKGSQPAAVAAPAPARTDAALADRLEDELRSLD